MISPSEYETLRSLHRNNHQQCSYLSIDTERWENSTSFNPKLIELGWSVLLPSTVDPSRQQHSTHFIIEENKHFSNSKYVPDERDAFAFGLTATGTLKQLEINTETLTHANGTRTATLAQAAAALQRVIGYLASIGSVLLLFHDARGGESERMKQWLL